MRNRKSFLTWISTLFFLIACMPVVFAVADEGEDTAYVPETLVVKAAQFYGNQRWPASNVVSITPYYALDGSINAWAVQFAKEESSLSTESEIYEIVAAAEAQQALIRDNPPSEGRSAKPEEEGAHDAALNDSNISVTVTEDAGSNGFKVSAVLPSDALDKGSKGGEEARSQKVATKAWHRELRKARNAAVLADEVGTVIMAGRYDLFPVLERFDGVAPHIKHLSKVKELLGIPEMQGNVIERSYYLGPFAVFHEVRMETAGAGKFAGKNFLVNPLNPVDLQVLDLDAPRGGELGTGRLSPASAEKSSISPQSIWESFDQQGTPPKVGGAVPEYEIPGVPYYHQDDYGPASCGPTASSQAVGYWDDHGFGNLVDNGSSDPTDGHVNEMIYQMMFAVDYDPAVGTYGSEIEPGIEAFCNNNAYGNNLSFNVVTDSSISWSTDILSNINANRPFVYFNWASSYPGWAHFTTGTGYNDNTAGSYFLYVHYNYPPDTPYELNWSNISPSNEEMYKVYPNTTAPFECVWSEDFESTFPGPWWIIEQGGSDKCWDDESYKAHNVTDDPCPPGGNPEWGAYCADLPTHAYPNDYDNNMDTWMVYGPFSTVGRKSGEISADVWRIIADSSDGISLLTSTNGVNFGGLIWRGNVPSWNRLALNLNNVMNHPAVWVGVRFSSNDSNTAEGAYVDDVVIKLNDPGVVCDFSTDGLWTHDGTTWTQMTTWNPSAMVSWRDKLAVDFSSDGLWVREGTSWTRLTTWNPIEMVAWGDKLAVDFSTDGLWTHNGTTWTRLTTWNPSYMAVWTNKLVVDFDSNGLWEYNGTTWTRLTTWDATRLVAWGKKLAVDFGSNGLWVREGTSWTQLTTWNPIDMVAWGDKLDKLAVDFSTDGLWVREGTSWTQLTTWNPDRMEPWGGKLVVDFGSNGLWVREGTSWTQLTTWQAYGLQNCGSKLAVNFGSNGLWVREAALWTNLTAWSPTEMESW